MKPRFESLERIGQMLRESVAVLAAILVAFSLDAWWEDRQEHERMLDALQAVAVETRRNIDLIDAALADNRESVAASQEVLRLETSDLDQASSEDLQRWASFPSYEEVRLQMGAVTAFIEGGFLAEMPDLELRSKLAGIPRLQEEIDEEAAGVARVQWRFSEQYSSLVPIDEVLASIDRGGQPSELYLRAILDDDPTRQLVLNRSFLLGTLYAAELQLAREDLVSVIEALDDWRASQD